MNDKITELKKLAGLYTDISGRWSNANAVDKFADLLLMECVDVLLLNGYDDAANQLNKDFGIEE